MLLLLPLLSVVLLQLVLALLPALLHTCDSMPANLVADGHAVKERLLLLLLSLLLVRVIAKPAAVPLLFLEAAEVPELLWCMLPLAFAGS
jgi:hypothetical protein